MKLDENSDSVQRSTLGERKFTIKASGKAFDILSSKIYKNPIKAVVRETSTNAYDSHVEAFKVNIPFNVHLPNYADPVFRIRDFGTGLSKDDIEKIWTTYFDSTRTGSDDYVGCLGLGSKSPFAYTKQFAVRSFYNGVVYVFSAFKNEDGEPSIAFLGESQTNEPNGLEISIPVQSADFAKFAVAAQEVYPFFEVKPNINFTIQDLVPVLKTQDFTLCERVNNNGILPALAIKMGQVAYNIEDIGSYLGNDFWLNTILIINGKMGDFSIAASREELHQNEKTTTNIELAIKKAVEDIRAHFVSLMIAEPIAFNAMKVASYASSLGINGLYHSMPAFKNEAYRLYSFRSKRQDSCELYEAEKIHPSHKNKTFFVVNDKKEITPADRRKIAYLQKLNSSAIIYVCYVMDSNIFNDTFPSTHLLSQLPSPPAKPRVSPRYALSGVRELHTGYNGQFYWMPPAIIETTNACKITFDRCNHTRAGKVAKLLGYKNVYGLTENKYDKHQLPDLRQEAIKAIKAEIAALTPEELCYLNHFPKYSFNTLLLKIAPESIANSGKTTERIKRIEILSGLAPAEIPQGEDLFKAFFDKYPLLLYLSTWDNDLPLNEVKKYMQS